MAMPTPATKVAAYRSHTWPPPKRRARPTATHTTDSSIAPAAPMRAATRWAMGANAPMHSTGSVVRAPRAALDSPRSVPIDATTGGTLAIAVRRLTATATSPRAMSHRGGRWCRRAVIGASLSGRRSALVRGVGHGLRHHVAGLLQGQPGEHQEVHHHGADLGTHDLARQAGRRVEDRAGLTDP